MFRQLWNEADRGYMYIDWGNILEVTNIRDARYSRLAYYTLNDYVKVVT